MRNIKLTLEYDGGRYQGWARLGKHESNNSISNKLIEVLEKMTHEHDIELFCGCRTEVGVHAYAQIVNFKTDCSMKCQDMKYYLNRYLPTDISILDVQEMPERFHAQLNAVTKIYTYRMSVCEAPSVFERKYVYHCFKTPDIALMQQAAQLLIGKHDFKNFSTAKKTKSTIRQIKDIDIYGDSKEIQFTIEADDFLHNMARLLIGTLIEIGLGNHKKEDIERIFAGKSAVSEPCDPKGLFLQEIKY